MTGILRTIGLAIGTIATLLSDLPAQQGDPAPPQKPAQRPEPDVRADPSGETTRIERIDEGGTVEIVEHADGTVDATEAAVNVPAELRGDHRMSVAVSTRPRRLAPGESGELFVTLSFRQGVMALPEDEVELEWAPGTSPFQLGQHRVEPATVAEIAASHRGRPAYDETMVIRVPITVGRQAEHKRYPVEGKLRLTLHQSSSGSSIGEHAVTIPGQVLVGPPLPRLEVPDVRAAAASAARGAAAGQDRKGAAAPAVPVPSASTPAASTPAGGAGGAARPGPADVTAAQPAGGQAGGPAGRLAPSDPGAALPVPPRGAGAGPAFPWIYGGLGLLGLLLIGLLLRRR